MITSPPHLVELRPGTKPGYVEVIFPWKPAKDETVSLRRAGFRFTVSNGPARWYGKAENAPEGLKAGVQALESLKVDHGTCTACERPLGPGSPCRCDDDERGPFAGFLALTALGPSSLGARS